MYPAARILRMDADTTKNKDSYEEILSAFANNEADILIGTQMIVKGHDFKGVTLVGILAADMALNAEDYRAGERAFEQLVQAGGRAGRSSGKAGGREGKSGGKASGRAGKSGGKGCQAGSKRKKHLECV